MIKIHDMINLTIQSDDVIHDLSFSGDDLVITKVDFEATTVNWVWYGVTIFNILVVNSLVLFTLNLKAKIEPETALKIFIIITG